VAAREGSRSARLSWPRILWGGIERITRHFCVCTISARCTHESWTIAECPIWSPINASTKDGISAPDLESSSRKFTCSGNFWTPSQRRLFFFSFYPAVCSTRTTSLSSCMQLRCGNRISPFIPRFHVYICVSQDDHL
jgi:hypothetical protein